jgi:homoserine kinase
MTPTFEGLTGSPITVRVPASTSNLGPGFDLLGLALSISLEVDVALSESGTDEWRALEGTSASWPTGAENLVPRAIDAALGTSGRARPALSFSARSEIPVGRGLGSSGAAIVAGLLIGEALRDGHGTGEPIARGELARIGCELEGHPDNVTASLYGGCTLALPHATGLAVVRQPLHASIGFAVAWPSTSASTEAGRRALPASVAFEDAVENPRRLAMLLEGLRTGDPQLLALGGEDRLHARVRLALIRGGEAALLAAKGAGAWIATVSGSGSTLIALGAHDRASDIAEAMRLELDRVDGPATARVVAPVLEPPAVRAL